MQDEQERWITVQDITRRLQVHEETVRRWIRSGELPAILLGSAKGGYRIREVDYDRFIQEQATQTVKSAA